MTELKPAEMDQGHRERVKRLLFDDIGGSDATSSMHFLAAYQAVLTKDLLWATNELLEYKQREVHR